MGGWVSVAWYATSFDPTVASVRIRCLQIIDAMNAAGCAAEQYSAAREEQYETVVFVKAHDEGSLALARSLQERGRRIVFDLCDNHFFGGELNHVLAARAARLREILTLADRIVVASPVLRGQVIAQLPALEARIAVIPDALDRSVTSPGSLGRPTPIGRLRLWRVGRFLGRHPNHLHLVWFGSKGVAYTQSGLLELRKVHDVLEQQHQLHRLTLTVISNSYRKFRSVCGRWRIPLHYASWDLAVFAPILALHDAAIVPITHNPFNDAKTINRPATALSAGIGVIADRIESYEELRSFIFLDDWPGGIEGYAVRRDLEAKRIRAAQLHLSQEYSVDKVAAEWIRVLAR